MLSLSYYQQLGIYAVSLSFLQFIFSLFRWDKHQLSATIRLVTNLHWTKIKLFGLVKQNQQISRQYSKYSPSWKFDWQCILDVKHWLTPSHTRILKIASCMLSLLSTTWLQMALPQINHMFRIILFDCFLIDFIIVKYTNLYPKHFQRYWLYLKPR